MGQPARGGQYYPTPVSQPLGAIDTGLTRRIASDTLAVRVTSAAEFRFYNITETERPKRIYDEDVADGDKADSDAGNTTDTKDL